MATQIEAKIIHDGKDTQWKLKGTLSDDLSTIEEPKLFNPDPKTGDPRWYTTQMENNGVVVAPMHVENKMKDSNFVGIVKPTIFNDNGSLLVLTEEDPGSLIQNEFEPENCLRAVRSSGNNPKLGLITPGQEMSSGYANDARIKGRIKGEFTLIDGAPSDELRNGSMYDTTTTDKDGNVNHTATYYRALTMPEYRKTGDVLGKGFVLDAVTALVEEGVVDIVARKSTN